MKLFGLIGRKLGHSFSANYFNEKFEREGIDASYKLFEIPSVEGISNILKEYPELLGLNVTIPYKRDVIPYCNSLTDTAREIGAVNTLLISHNPDGTSALTGHNTDAPGFADALRPLLSGQKHALVLGLGGASLAVIYALKKMGMEVTKVSRKKSSEDILTYAELTEEIIRRNKIIVNCTPLGMWPNVETCVDIPYQYLTSNHVCFDLVYNPEETEFMKRSVRYGAKVSNGLQMLHNQANFAWKFWNKTTFACEI